MLLHLFAILVLHHIASPAPATERYFSPYIIFPVYVTVVDVPPPDLSARVIRMGCVFAKRAEDLADCQRRADRITTLEERISVNSLWVQYESSIASNWSILASKQEIKEDLASIKHLKQTLLERYPFAKIFTIPAKHWSA